MKIGKAVVFPVQRYPVSHENFVSEKEIIQEDQASADSLAGDAVNSVKGFCMGVCDAVPGVSGGTVALVVGIYERLFAAISHVDRQLGTYLKTRQLGKAATYIDARFLFSLIVGMGLGYVVMSVVIKFLMSHDILRALTLASFAGMVLGSLYVVFKMIQPQGQAGKWVCIGWGITGCAMSSMIAFQSSSPATAEVSLIYLFCCTVVAIVAMILPGISGAMLLLIFGVYYDVVEIPGNLIHFENVGDNLIKLGVFFSGCVVGLLTFSRLIKWLLSSYRAVTLAGMLGLMTGSLVVLWPFQHRLEPITEHHKPTYDYFVPGEFSTVILAVTGCVIFFAGCVVFGDRLAQGITNSRKNQTGAL